MSFVLEKESRGCVSVRTGGIPQKAKVTLSGREGREDSASARTRIGRIIQFIGVNQFRDKA